MTDAVGGDHSILDPRRDGIQDMVVSEARRLGLVLQEVEASCLRRYLLLLVHWGRRLNLTGRPDVSTLVARQLPDALVLSGMLREAVDGSRSAVDVGAGAGLVGVPLLVLQPQLRLELVESSRKKCAFLRAALHELGLHAAVLPLRVEEACLAPRDLVVSRATFAPAVWAEIGGALLADGGRLACFLAREEPPEAAGLVVERLVDYELSDGSPRRVVLLKKSG